MPELILHRAMPEHWGEFEEFPRDFKPIEVVDQDLDRIFQDPDGSLHQRRRRTRVVVCRDAQGNPAAVPYDIGPAEGYDMFMLPCSEVTELAHIFELMDYMARFQQQRMKERAEREPQRTAAMLDGLQVHNERAQKHNVAQSIYGPGGHTQRG